MTFDSNTDAATKDWRHGTLPAAGEMRPDRSPLPAIARAATGNPIGALRAEALAEFDLAEDQDKHARSLRR